MQTRYPLRIREHAAAAGGTYDYVKSSIVPPGQIWHISELAYENETGARGTFRRYIEGHGYNHYLAELQGPGSGELIHSDNGFDLLPGERLTVRQTSCTAADVLSLYAIGYMVKGEFIEGGTD